MKKIFITFFCILCLISKVNAETFIQALKKAYEDNSELNAERESINISEKNLKYKEVINSSFDNTVTNLPNLYPAIKRGQQVEVIFTMPIIISTE